MHIEAWPRWGASSVWLIGAGGVWQRVRLSKKKKRFLVDHVLHVVDTSKTDH